MYNSLTVRKSINRLRNRRMQSHRNRKPKRLIAEVKTESPEWWGISSVGRAPALHAGGQEFEPPILHFFKKEP